jgi:hypothetical protein
MTIAKRKTVRALPMEFAKTRSGLGRERAVNLDFFFGLTNQCHADGQSALINQTLPSAKTLRGS